MVKAEESIKFDLPMFIRRIESKEQFTAITVTLLNLKKQNPEEGTVKYLEMMYLYDLFNEYIERTGEQTVEIPEEFFEICNFPSNVMDYAL